MIIVVIDVLSLYSTDKIQNVIPLYFYMILKKKTAISTVTMAIIYPGKGPYYAC